MCQPDLIVYLICFAVVARGVGVVVRELSLNIHTLCVFPVWLFAGNALASYKWAVNAFGSRVAVCVSSACGLHPSIPPAPPPPTPGGGGGEHMVHVCGAENVCLLTPLGPLEYVLRSSRGVRNVYLKLTLDCRMAFRATTTKKLRCRF